MYCIRADIHPIHVGFIKLIGLLHINSLFRDNYQTKVVFMKHCNLVASNPRVATPCAETERRLASMALKEFFKKTSTSCRLLHGPRVFCAFDALV